MKEAMGEKERFVRLKWRLISLLELEKDRDRLSDLSL